MEWMRDSVLPVSANCLLTWISSTSPVAHLTRLTRVSHISPIAHLTCLTSCLSQISVVSAASQLSQLPLASLSPLSHLSHHLPASPLTVWSAGPGTRRCVCGTCTAVTADTCWWATWPRCAACSTTAGGSSAARTTTPWRCGTRRRRPAYTPSRATPTGSTPYR